MHGGAIEEYRVVVDPARLMAHGLTVSDVATALSASNVLTAVGHIEDHDKLYLIVSDTRLKTSRQLAATVLHSGTGGIIRFSDVRQCGAKRLRNTCAPTPTDMRRFFSVSFSSPVPILCRSPARHSRDACR